MPHFTLIPALGAGPDLFATLAGVGFMPLVVAALAAALLGLVIAGHRTP